MIRLWATLDGMKLRPDAPSMERQVSGAMDVHSVASDVACVLVHFTISMKRFRAFLLIGMVHRMCVGFSMTRFVLVVPFDVIRFHEIEPKAKHNCHNMPW